MVKSHSSYKILIQRSLRSLNPFNKVYVSPISIKKLIERKYGFKFLKISNYYFRKALQDMIDAGLLEKHEDKYMFRLRPKGKKAESKKKGKKAVKKVAKKSIQKKITTTKKKDAKPKKQLKKENKPAPMKSGSQVNLPKKPSFKANAPAAQTKVNLTKKASLKGGRYPIWQYYDHFNVQAKIQSPDGWYDYERKASDIVEEEWQKYIKNRMMCDVRAVRSGHFEYQVDFMSWTQTNLSHHAHKVRKIRRLDESGGVTVNPYQ